MPGSASLVTGGEAIEPLRTFGEHVTTEAGKHTEEAAPAWPHASVAIHHFVECHITEAGVLRSPGQGSACAIIEEPPPSVVRFRRLVAACPAGWGA